jgi:hypothetical protein
MHGEPHHLNPTGEVVEPWTLVIPLGPAPFLALVPFVLLLSHTPCISCRPLDRASGLAAHNSRAKPPAMLGRMGKALLQYLRQKSSFRMVAV